MRSRRGAGALPVHPEESRAFHDLWQVIGGRRDEAQIPVNENIKPVIEGFLRFLDHRIRAIARTPKGRRKLRDSSMSTSSISTRLELPSAADTRKTAPTLPEAGC